MNANSDETDPERLCFVVSRTNTSAAISMTVPINFEPSRAHA